MTKKLIYLIMLLAISVACSNQQQTSEATDAGDEAAVELSEVTVANFIDKAGDLVGQQVKISGLVNHTCKHGGKRMFLVDEGTEESVKIEAGENIDSFDAELEGNIVNVVGIVAEAVVDESYLDEWEKEVLEDSGEEEYKIHDGNHEGEENHGEGEEGETEEDHHGTDLEKIENLRTMLADSGKDHLSFFSIECVSYEVAPPPPPAN